MPAVDKPRRVPAQVLKLEKNRLTSLPDWMAAGLPKLRILFLAFNPITEVPAAIGQMTALEMLSLRDCQLTEIRDHQLPTSLTWLILTNNRLTRLPPSLGELRRVRKLMLSGNRLTELPASLSACTSLELLRLAGNGLTAIPPGLEHLDRLGWVALGDNPVAELVGNGDQAEQRHIPCVTTPDLRCTERLGAGTSGDVYKCAFRHDGGEHPELEDGAGDNGTPMVLKKYRAGRGSDGSNLDFGLISTPPPTPSHHTFLSSMPPYTRRAMC